MRDPQWTSLSDHISYSEPLRSLVGVEGGGGEGRAMRPENVSTCSSTERRRPNPGHGMKPTLHGAQGSSSCGLYVLGLSI